MQSKSSTSGIDELQGQKTVIRESAQT